MLEPTELPGQGSNWELLKADIYRVSPQTGIYVCFMDLQKTNHHWNRNQVVTREYNYSQLIASPPGKGIDRAGWNSVE